MAAATICTASFAFKPLTLHKKITRFRPKPLLSNYLFHSFEESRILCVVICEVRFLCVSISKSSWSHARAAFMVCPSIIWILGHLAGRKCVSCVFFMAWSIVKQKKASCKSMSPVFKDVDGFVNLTKEVTAIKITIPILSSLEYNVSISVNTHLRNNDLIK
jgi:hypothetical protein